MDCADLQLVKEKLERDLGRDEFHTNGAWDSGEKAYCKIINCSIDVKINDSILAIRHALYDRFCCLYNQNVCQDSNFVLSLFNNGYYAYYTSLYHTASAAYYHSLLIDPKDNLDNKPRPGILTGSIIMSVSNAINLLSFVWLLLNAKNEDNGTIMTFLCGKHRRQNNKDYVPGFSDICNLLPRNSDLRKAFNIVFSISGLSMTTNELISFRNSITHKRFTYLIPGSKPDYNGELHFLSCNDSIDLTLKRAKADDNVKAGTEAWGHISDSDLIADSCGHRLDVKDLSLTLCKKLCKIYGRLASCT